MLALFVDITVKPGVRDEFAQAIRSQAASSLAEEEGCLRFDVTVDVENADRFLLYEVYADEEAFQAHRRTPHFGRWSEAKARYVERQVSVKAELL